MGRTLQKETRIQVCQVTRIMSQLNYIPEYQIAVTCWNGMPFSVRLCVISSRYSLHSAIRALRAPARIFRLSKTFTTFRL
jgi:hypothetical protein